MNVARAVTFTLLAAVLPWSPGAASAQVLYGSLTGNVVDISGASVRGVQVEALNVNTSIAKRAVADERGAYLIADLQPGVYNVTFKATGFSDFVQSAVQIGANTVRRIDVQLKLAVVGQSLTVVADSTPLQTDRSDVAAQISTAQTSDLPMAGARDFQNLFKFLPGFTPVTGGGSPSASSPAGYNTYTVNGATQFGNNTKIDGASDIYPWQPQGVMLLPPAESVESVSIATNSLDAEQGGVVGAAVNVTLKSGTNEFHGAAWEYTTNSDLKARNFFYYGSANPKNILNQFGLDTGGPIKKNKLFFFADWERSEYRQLYTAFQTVATDPLKQGNFANTGTVIYDPTTGTASGTGRTPFPNNQIPASAMSSAALKMAALLPQPNQPGSITNNYFASGDWSFGRDNIDAKVNYNPSHKSSLFARYSVAPNRVSDPQVLGPAGGAGIDGGTPGIGTGLTQHVSIGGTYTFTPTLLLDGNAAFSRLHATDTNTDISKNYGSDVLGIPGTNGPSPMQGGYPGFTFVSFSSLGNSNTSNPLIFRDDMWVQSVNLSWSKGSHSLRFGAEFVHILMADFQANSTVGVRGGFSFSGGLSALSGGAAPNLYNSWADFLLGLPATMGQDHQYINPAVVAENEFFFYARDQWQVSRKLTFTYGLRYENYPYSHGEHGIGGIHYDPSTNLVYLGGIGGVPDNAHVDTGHGMFAPRFGLAYRLNAKTVLRAGWGININPETFRNNIQTFPDVIPVQYSGANSYAAAGSLVTGIPAFVGPVLSSGQVPLPTNVGSWEYPSPFRRGYEETYNVTIQRDLWAGFNLQAGWVANRDIRPESGVNINAAAPGTGKNGQPLYLQWGNASQISELLPLPQMTYNSLQARLVRHLGKGTFGTSYTFSKALDAADTETGGSLTWNWGPVRYRDYSLAGPDRTHDLSAYFVYPLPLGKNQRWLNHGVAAAVAGGWQVNGVLTRASGTPFTVSSSATPLNAPGNSETANQVVQHVQILGGHGPGAPYFDPNAFLPVTTATFGNSGRDILRGPGLFDLDGGLFRTFPIKERFNLQFRAEAFGLTNTPSFGNPATTVSNATFVNGAATNLNGYDIITSSTGDRQFRFALKLSF